MSLTRRGPNQYQIQWEIGRDPETGKRRTISERFHGTRKAALERFVERQRDLNNGVGRERPDVTLRELAADWIAHKQSQGRRAATLRGYEEMLRDFILPRLGPIKVRELTVLDVQRAVHHWTTQPRKDGRTDRETVSPRTVQYAYRTLSTMLKQAMRWQIVSQNVAELVESPSVPRPERSWWSAEQAAQFLGVAQDHMHGIVFALALLTGLRKGELLGLRWQDVDWDANMLTIRQKQDHRHPRTFDAPKSDAGYRTIGLDEETMQLLRAHQTAQKRQRLIAGEAYQDWGLVCATGIGTPLLPSNVRREFNKLIAKANVPKIRFHDLRHTHGSLLRAAGADFRVIANRLGHAQVSFTIQTYTHASTDAQVPSASAVAKSVLGSRSESS